MTQSNKTVRTDTTQAQDVKGLRPSASLSPEKRQQMLDDGWDIEAWDALFMNDQEPETENSLEVPYEIFLQGFAVAAKRPLMGYGVELWLHHTGRDPFFMLMRPRYAIQLAELIERAPRRKGFVLMPESLTTDFDETIRVQTLLNGGVRITTNEIGVSFAKREATSLAAQLRGAAIAHKSTERTTLAA